MMSLAVVLVVTPEEHYDELCCGTVNSSLVPIRLAGELVVAAEVLHDSLGGVIGRIT